MKNTTGEKRKGCSRATGQLGEERRGPIKDPALCAHGLKFASGLLNFIVEGAHWLSHEKQTWRGAITE